VASTVAAIEGEEEAKEAKHQAKLNE